MIAKKQPRKIYPGHLQIFIIKKKSETVNASPEKFRKNSDFRLPGGEERSRYRKHGGLRSPETSMLYRFDKEELPAQAAALNGSRSV